MGRTCPCACTASRGELRTQVAEGFGLTPPVAVWHLIEAWRTLHGRSPLPMEFTDVEADAVWDAVDLRLIEIADDGPDCG